MVLLTWVVNTFVDRFMSKEFTGFSFLLPSARWLVAEGCVTVSFCVSTTVASTWAAATHSWSYTSKKNVSFPSRVTSQRVSWWCLLKWNPMVFSCSHSNIVAFPFHLLSQKMVSPTDAGWAVQLGREAGPTWLSDLGRGTELRLTQYMQRGSYPSGLILTFLGGHRII